MEVDSILSFYLCTIFVHHEDKQLNMNIATFKKIEETIYNKIQNNSENCNNYHKVVL